MQKNAEKQEMLFSKGINLMSSFSSLNKVHELELTNKRLLTPEELMRIYEKHPPWE